MVYSIAEHIISPLGVGIEANLTALHEGRTALQRHNAVHGTTLVEPIYGSVLPDTPYLIDGYTLFESWCICCVQGALHKAINSSFLASPRTVFILSSTKGDIWTPNTETARHIAQFFGNTQSPIVVSLACTSGVSAQITAWRLLECGLYDTAVVIGCDVLTDFVAAGFQCVHATSMQPCRPFDKDREGLNLGEAVGCLILRHSINSHECGASIHHSINSSLAASAAHQWSLLGGSIHNDANHISG
ncbi:MAG: hypothetical protein MJZ55_06100, partial [Paludibacteraceae bacterium]|nr:hypothetical protein [Paludibacteraceae bacterium]